MSGKKTANKGLGRGLASLIPNINDAPLVAQEPAIPQENVSEDRVRYIKVKDILPNPFQPRQTWDLENLKELADSIKTSGLLQPLLVRLSKADPNKFELIAGERRLRALEHIGSDSAPVIIREVNDRESLEIAIIENVQREDLNPIDEALAYERLNKEFSYSQEQLAKRVGKDRTTVTNSMRLLNLPEDILNWVKAGKISAGHARSLLSLSQDKDRMSLAKLIIDRGLSVRETERIVREARERRKPKKGQPPAVNPHVRFLEEALMAKLGTKVTVKHRGGKGKIEIEYYSLEDLDRVVAVIKKD